MAGFNQYNFIPHPPQIPVQLVLASPLTATTTSEDALVGVCLIGDHAYPVDAQVQIRIHLPKQDLAACGRVAHCIPDKTTGRYRIGLLFSDRDTAYAVRMFEQLCHIEQYRRHVLREQGRPLTDEAAALEWINQYAQRFPTLPDVDTTR